MSPSSRAQARRSEETTPGAPTLPEVEQHVLTAETPGVGRVVESRLCTLGGAKASSYVRHIAIDVAGTPMGGRFQPGQSFGVIPPGVDERGRPHKLRLYSIASPARGEDGAGGVVATTVKRTIAEVGDEHRLHLGVASNYLCDLRVGDEVSVTGPAGKRFLLPVDRSAHDYIFFATGTGIAPFRAMLLELLADTGFTGKATLIMGSPYSTDLLYDGELRALESRHAGFTYLTAISREAPAPSPTGTPRGPYVQDRLRTHADLLTPLLESERTLIYICGVAGMEIGILRGLAISLQDGALAQYVTLDEKAPADPAQWDRRMIPRQIRPTRRLFMEVY